MIPAPTPGTSAMACAPVSPAEDGQTSSAGDTWAHAYNAVPADCAPDLSLDDITNGRLARLIEQTRMVAMLQQDAKNAAGKLKRECIASQVRNEMQRDGVLSHKIKGLGTFKLYPRPAAQPCGECMEKFGLGGGDRDPYLGVYPEVRIA